MCDVFVTMHCVMIKKKKTLKTKAINYSLDSFPNCCSAFISEFIECHMKNPCSISLGGMSAPFFYAKLVDVFN